MPFSLNDLQEFAAMVIFPFAVESGVILLVALIAIALLSLFDAAFNS